MPSTPTVQPLTFRLEKGTPLTAAEGDNNLRILRDALNSALALMGVALNPDGTLKNPPIVYGASVVGTDAYAITPTPAIAALADLIGKLVILKADVANTGAATIAVSGLAATPILKFGNQALENSDIKAGMFVILSYDGANFQMESQPGVVQPVNYGQDVGTANTYVVNQGGINQIPAALYTGLTITVKAANANTGASTLQLGATAATSIKRTNLIDLQSGDILTGNMFTVTYDGTQFVMLSARRPYLLKISTALSLPAAAGVVTFAHGISAVPNNYWGEIYCNDAGGDAGYAQNDVVAMGAGCWGEPSAATGQESTAFVLTADATNLKCVVAGGSTIELWLWNKDGTGTAAMIDRTKWRIRLYAAYF